MSVLAVLLVSMTVLFLLGLPIYAALAIAATLSLATSDILPLAVIQSSFYDGMNIFPLLAIPCFIVAGALMERGNITEQIINVVRTLVGRIYGGIGITTILACAVFASITGSATSTVAAIGAIMVPAMVRNGYSPTYAGACSASGGTIGILIPPSNPMIIYAIMANVSISGMFAAGFIPGFIMAAALSLAAYFIARKNGFKADESIGPFRFMDFLRTCKESFLSLATVVIVLGSIYSGLATPVEASVVAVVWALFVGSVINRALSWQDIYDSLMEGVILCGSITIIVGASTLFGKILTYEEAPVRLANYLMELTRNKYVIILLIVAMLYVLGMFIETLAMVIIVTPVLVPVLVQLHIDLIHFGIVMVMANEVGLLTPPMGVNLFVAARLTGATVERLAVAVLPYIGVMTSVILLIVFCPILATFLPRLLGLG
ncbi:MAG: TRAP transporter large permease [Methylobacteriaceae bacterium]|jgi:C4-dicarboxylate transporter DctM subunit|nr:TRAP transporter large permease [Methylobacteriaceae bacterium]